MSPADQAFFREGVMVDLVIPSEELEKDAQANFAIACKERGWRPVWHGMHKRSTANRGCPDFIVGARGTTFWIEFKRPGEKLAPDQRVFEMQLAQNGITMFTVYSAQQAVDLIENYELES
jgi:hypothetical protein